jgi:hypothetical protein
MLTQGTENQHREKWIILVGVDYYIPGDKGECRSMRGAVQDVFLVEQYLVQTYSIREDHISKLIATEPTSGCPRVSNRSELDNPTSENIKRALKDVTDKAKPGDFVYFHYSGHSVQVKGEDGLDAVALAPMDVNCGGPYLRDVELKVSLQKMVDKKLIVTVVIDGCYSGGAVGGVVREAQGSVAQGLGRVDTSRLPSDSQHSRSTSSRAGMFRKREFNSSWKWPASLEPHGFALLAACRPDETAQEYKFQDGKYNGIFTYWLVHTLKLSNAEVTHRILCERVSEKVYGQTPVSGGTVERVFMGSVKP